jgi:RHS repeat-associated protein
MEYDANRRMTASTLNGLQTTYAYDADGRRAMEVGGTARPCTTCYLTEDGLGSIRQTMDGSGTVKGYHDYLPFGEELNSVAGRSGGCWGAADTTLRFTGNERDPETLGSAMSTGLDYFDARYYSGAQGRFTSPDPEIIPRDITNPQAWNKYAYTYNNPLANVDPDGRATLPAKVQQLLQRYAPDCWRHAGKVGE